MTSIIDAARCTGVLWAAIRAAAGPRPAARRHQHFPAAFDAAWLASLALPTSQGRPAVQPVALLGARREQFERHWDGPALEAAYARQPWTMVLEDIGHDQQGTWYQLAAWHLTRLSGSEPHDHPGELDPSKTPGETP
jgi:hypothetical protein